MRVTKYVMSDGEQWMLLRLRHSAHQACAAVNDELRKAGWIPYNIVREKLNTIKKKVAAQNPTKYKNWKEVKIPMRAPKQEQVPKIFLPYMETEVANEPANKPAQLIIPK